MASESFGNTHSGVSVASSISSQLVGGSRGPGPVQLGPSELDRAGSVPVTKSGSDVLGKELAIQMSKVNSAKQSSSESSKSGHQHEYKTGYAQAGQMNEALEIFENMEERNRVTWNSLISSFNQNGLYLDALRHSASMGREGMKPDQSTFTPCLSACANLATLQMGKQIHHFAMKTGYSSDLFVANALITMYLKCGRVSSAEQVFKDIDGADLISWNSMCEGPRHPEERRINPAQPLAPPRQ
ncbi:hypothetical protein Syun_015025 [Stephania yunnanensis]|uniref:Pentatricopeptide repeat-containing protein n=1 Tax=Stephania yunnanensis TaxID=152371 RepID=A0AAP0JL99_9MAGN